MTSGIVSENLYPVKHFLLILNIVSIANALTDDMTLAFITTIVPLPLSNMFFTLE